MTVTTTTTRQAELDAMRTAARAEVHRRAARAAVGAIDPTGMANAVWSRQVADLVDDILDIFQLTVEQRAEIGPDLLRGVGDLIAHYAPPSSRAGLMAGLVETLQGSGLARRAARGAATRFGARLVAGAGIGGRAVGLVARRAWLVPLAIGGGTGVLYELLGRRCINQCHTYLSARLPAAPAR